jgi:23S rRNA (guanosine2251-2'-O)-methyltransferase
MTDRRNQPVYIYGKNPFQEGLLAINRGSALAFKRLLLTKQAEADPKVMSLVQSNKLTYAIVTYAEIESLIGRDAVHQGICAEIDEEDLYTPLEEVLSTVSKDGPSALFILLDELQDPHNVGAIIRSAVAFGATAILIPEHNQTQINGTVIKTASGMNFAIPIVHIGNINMILTKLKDRGFWTYGLTGEGDTRLSKATFDTHTVIVIGSEGEGIRAKTLENCDFKLSIETSELCESLNASNAATVTMYEWSRQQP